MLEGKENVLVMIEKGKVDVREKEIIPMMSITVKNRTRFVVESIFDVQSGKLHFDNFYSRQCR